MFDNTAFQESTAEPTWEAEPLVFMSIASQLQSELVLIVRHKDVLTSTEVTLGMAIVDLATVLGSPEITWEAWHPLRKIPSMHVEDSVLGEILVRVTYFISGMLEEEMESLPEQSMDISDGYQELAGKAPNFLTISVHTGWYLIPPTGKTVCDSIVVVKCAGYSKTSKKVLRSNFPKWNFACEVSNSNYSYATSPPLLIMECWSLCCPKPTGYNRFQMQTLPKCCSSLCII